MKIISSASLLVLLTALFICSCGPAATTTGKRTSDSISQLPAKNIIKREDQKLDLYAPGIMVGKTLYICGHGDFKPGEDYSVKTRGCLDGIGRTLKMAGLGFENVVQTWVMLEDMTKMEEMNRTFAEYFPNNPPARTTFGAAQIPGESEMEITAIAYADLSERKILGETGRLFSSGVLAGNTLYIAGKGSALPDGKHPPTFEEQVRQAMRKVGDTLRMSGLDYRHVVCSNVYIDNYDNYGIVNKVYSEFFEFGNEPARLTIFSDEIPGGSHIEITCIATTDLATRRVVRPSSMIYGPEGLAMTRSPAVWAGNTLYMSYQTGYVPGKGIISTDLGNQFRQMARNHYDVLDEAGLKHSDIVWGHVFLRDVNDYGEMNKIYREYFTNPPGVRTCFQPNWGYEKNDILVRSLFIAARCQ
ncbi:MAG: RidA family protein [Candidatus Latescibacteria bacterium]|jgi:enamine deaminase RidA (YjgF/YER057c/UK114 family)|nr:RidA family protein [Candidatus Latescibacterota bacterium]